MSLSNNEKKITAKWDCEKLYLPVGYPLGFELKDGIPHDTKNGFKVYSPQDYMVELYVDKKLTIATLSVNEELHLWSNILLIQDKITRDTCDLDLLETLKGKSLIIEADTLSELVEKIFPLRATRQGVGWANEQSKCVYLGREMKNIEGLQSAIWRSARDFTIESIFSWFYKKAIIPFETYKRDFALAVVELTKNGLLILQ